MTQRRSPVEVLNAATNITHERDRNRELNLVGHKLAGMPNDPPPSAAAAAGPTLLVPEEGQRWSFEAKDASESDDERELTALQTAVDATYSAPAVLSRGTILLSPPSGTFDTELSLFPSSMEYG